MSNKIIGGVVGFAAGVPMSYHFQPDIIRAKLNWGQYLQKLPELLGDGDVGGEVFFKLLISVAIFSIIGFFVGYVIDSSKAKRKESNNEQGNNQLD